MQEQPFVTSLKADATYRLGDPILLTFEIENIGSRSYQLLIWGTPLEGKISDDFVTLRRDGEATPYDGRFVKRGEPSPQSYVTIAPGQRLSGTVDISTAYPIREPGDYTATLKASLYDAFPLAADAKVGARRRREHEPHSLGSPSVSFKIVAGAQPRLTSGESARQAPRLADIERKAKAPGFNGGTDDQRTDTVTAHNNAQYFVALSANQLQTVDAGTNSLYKEWFGAFDQSRYDTVTQHYNDINNALNNDTITYDFNGSDCDSDTFAYTHKGSRTIFLCTLYISAPEIGTDCKFGTLVHELSHAVSSTDDHVYGETKCRDLAINNPGDAITNADSHEYFAEHLAQSDFGKSVTLITDRDTFGADEITALGLPAVIGAACYVIADGFWPDKLGITAVSLGNSPNVKPTLSPAVPAITATSLAAEDPSLPIAPQRFTWTCQIKFSDLGLFPTTPGQVNTLTETASLAGITGSAVLQFIHESNPFELDGPTSWLSTDLRVFQIPEGQSRFGATVGSSEADACTYIQQVVQNLKSGSSGGETFDNISTDPETSKLELSEKVNGVRIFNFAVAKLHYRGTTDIDNVRVFFRLFPVASCSTAYDVNTTYRRASLPGKVIPTLGVNGAGDLLTIPCFANSRVDTGAVPITDQTDSPTNVRKVIHNGTNEVLEYFGCFLDINQTAGRFPTNPGSGNGPWTGLKSVQQLVRNAHQCLVAEIAFDPDPISQGATPGGSDKLAQRNLSIVESANPGDLASRRIPVSFEVRSAPGRKPDELADELMIDWGNIPDGSTATVFLPGIDAVKVVDLADALYGTHLLEVVDDHTLRCTAAGITYVPVPPEFPADSPGLLTVDLPAGVQKGQVFTVLVRQVTNTAAPPPVIIELREGPAVAAADSLIHWRKVLGSFQLTIPVRVKETMLEPEIRLLSVLRWIQKSIPKGDRWFEVFQRYVGETANRVDALGGDSDDVEASPSGEDVTLLLRILDKHGAFYGKPVDIEVKHRTLESEPGREFKRVVPVNVFPVPRLRRFPQSDYVVTITPSDHFHPEGQFVTIPPSGTAQLTFAFS